MITIYDGICGMGKTRYAVEKIKEITKNKETFSDDDDKVIFATIYRSECIRMADLAFSKSNTRNYKTKKNGDPDYLDKKHRKFSFLFKPSFHSGEKKRDKKTKERVLDQLNKNQNIVTTHAALSSFSDKILKIAQSKNYHLIIDETPPSIELLSLKDGEIDRKEYDNLIELGILNYDAQTTQISWSGKGDNLTRYKDLKEAVSNGKCYYKRLDESNKKNGKAYVVKLLNENIFKYFSNPFILTYYFKGTLLYPYLEISRLNYHVLDITKKNYSFESNIKIFDYDLLINLYFPKGIKESMYNKKHAFSSSWYKDQTQEKGLIVNSSSEMYILEKDQELDKKSELSILSRNTASFFKKNKGSTVMSKKLKNLLYAEITHYIKDAKLNTEQAQYVMNKFESFHTQKANKEYRLWTTFKSYGKLLTYNSSGMFSLDNFLAFNTKAKNDYIHTSKLAYLVNVFLNPNIANFISNNTSKNFTFDEDDYATSEIIQWVFRSRIRKGEFIELFISSSRMRNLLVDWMKNYRKMANDELKKKKYPLTDEEISSAMSVASHTPTKKTIKDIDEDLEVFFGIK